MRASQDLAATSTGSCGGSRQRGCAETGKRGTRGVRWAGSESLSACACMRLVVARGSDLVHERGLSQARMACQTQGGD